MVSIANAPRDAAQLAQCTRRQLYMLATNLHLLVDQDNEETFLAQSQEVQANTVLQGLLAYDASGGAGVAVQAAPAPAPVAAAPPPPQQVVAPPPAAQPAQYAAPPPQAAVAPPPATAVAAPPPAATPAAPPPVAPPQAPGGYAAPPPAAVPQPPPQAVVQPPPPAAPAPPPMGVPAPPPAATPAAPPAAAPPVMRQPQTASDPANTGAGSQLGQLTSALVKLQKGLEILGGGLTGVSKQVNSGVLVQKTILQVLLTMAELQGVTPETLVKQVKLGDPEAVEKFIAALGTQQGKG
jgi:hypothetical protein